MFIAKNLIEPIFNFKELIFSYCFYFIRKTESMQYFDNLVEKSTLLKTSFAIHHRCFLKNVFWLFFILYNMFTSF